MTAGSGRRLAAERANLQDGAFDAALRDGEAEAGAGDELENAAYDFWWGRSRSPQEPAPTLSDAASRRQGSSNC